MTPASETRQNNFATLGVQVSGLEKDYQELRRAVLGLDTKIESTVSALSSRFDAAIAGINSKLDARSQTPWLAIWAGLGVFITITVAVGGAMYAPLSSNQGRLDVAVSSLVNNGVFQRQYDADQARLVSNLSDLRKDLNTTTLTTVLRDRYQNDIIRLDAGIESLKQRQARNEDRYMLQSDFNAQHSDLKAFLASQVENLQREVVGLQDRLNQIWSARDAITDLRSRLDRLETK
jgi:hypothetical protein